MLSLFGIFPILSFLSLIGTFAIFSYLAVTERNAPKFTYLPREDVSHKIEDPKVTVVVTVKNEEEFIEKCLDSLTQQTYSSLEIIVVYDSSTDSTREIVEKLASNHSNLRLVSAGLKTPGWVGKSGRAGGALKNLEDVNFFFSWMQIQHSKKLLLNERSFMRTRIP